MKAELKVNDKELVIENNSGIATCKSELCEGISEMILKVDYTEKPKAELWLMKPREDNVHIVDYLHKDEGDTIEGEITWNDFFLTVKGDNTYIDFGSKVIPRVDFMKVNIPVDDPPRFTVSGFGLEVDDDTGE